MSKIDDLIAKMCPDGVEYQRLGGIAQVGTGSSNRDEAVADGTFPFYVRSKEIYRINSFEFNETAIVIPGEGGVGDIFHFVEGKYALHQRAYRIKLTDENVLPKFAFYHLKTHFKKFILSKAVDGTVVSIRKPMIEDFRIPLPPLEIQKEIVTILDKFTELEAELESELEARKKQYEFYRESLFGYATEHSEIKSIANVANIWRGRRFVKDDILEKGVPAIHYGEIYTRYGLEASEAFSFLDPELAAKLRFAKSGDVVLVSAGETIEDIGKSFAWFGKEDVVIHDACYGIRSSELDAKYMVHFFNTYNFRSQLRMYISSSKISAISTEKLGKVLIPVPTLKRQKEIANLLDRFDTLITNISHGLPAELAARRQQYEYFRNKLLTFKKLDVA